MRLFLAINLPLSVKNKLDQQLEKLKREYPHFNWVPKENFHITILFLGESDQIDSIKKRVEQATYDISSFRLYSQGAGLFLNKKVTLYTDFRREKEAEKLASRIKDIFQIKEESKFIPHVTIGRTRVPSKQQYLNLKKKLSQLKIEIDLGVTKIYLIQSILTGNKPKYKKLATFTLLIPLR
ncbi:2'-5' RNA ligase [Candidatus Roizmanbacteria bacterium RIFCSPLOWO2_02_FULL_37_9]|nr:MAG: 2'-5' RNA ligase [Candidatus Roizmanbacteria bacterium RIFCSPHIGHO2_12_FULL_36_11]OGK57660.1 MAG: 2'-5' RNA ligase [Candidatus Roizmanbacteria bacterium RIFCSPLOWO2_02_FULL_37_9]